MANETKFTKGPWAVGSPSGHNASTVFSGDSGIAQVYGIPLHCGLSEVSSRFAEGIANAHLIAAAPDLYAALTEIVERDGPAKPPRQGVAQAIHDKWMRYQRARAALSKARGES